SSLPFEIGLDSIRRHLSRPDRQDTIDYYPSQNTRPVGIFG
ncbi:unnamed protein product, partial [Didymodactylos carnosus]